MRKGMRKRMKGKQTERKNKLKKDNDCCFYLFKLFLKRIFSPIK